MAVFNYGPPGVSYTPAYQVSGYPWITGAATIGGEVEHQISFPYVTKNFTVLASSSAANVGKIRVSFASTGSTTSVINGMHYVELDGDEESFTFNVRCKEVWISTPAAAAQSGEDVGYTVYAELTNIPSENCKTMSGSGINIQD